MKSVMVICMSHRLSCVIGSTQNSDVYDSDDPEFDWMSVVRAADGLHNGVAADVTDDNVDLYMERLAHEVSCVGVRVAMEAVVRVMFD